MDKRYQQLAIASLEHHWRTLLAQQDGDPREVWEAILHAHAAITNAIAVNLSDAMADDPTREAEEDERLAAEVEQEE